MMRICIGRHGVTRSEREGEKEGPGRCKKRVVHEKKSSTHERGRGKRGRNEETRDARVNAVSCRNPQADTHRRHADNETCTQNWRDTAGSALVGAPAGFDM